MTRSTSILGPLALALLCACTKPQGGEGGHRMTTFQRACGGDAECGSLECLCGVCTRVCEGTSSCTDLEDDAACVTSSPAVCADAQQVCARAATAPSPKHDDVAAQDAATPAPSQDGSVASQDAATNAPGDVDEPCRVPFDPEFAGCRATLEEAMREDTSCSAIAECGGYTTWGYTGSFGSKICVYESGSLVGYRHCSDAPQNCIGRQALCHIAGDLPPDCNPYPPNFPGIPLC